MPTEPTVEKTPEPSSRGADFRRLAHDLNNLLGIIIGNVELMLDQPAPDAKALRRMQSIYQAGIDARDAIADAQVRLLAAE